MKIGDPSPSPKHGLVYACDDLKVGCLVLRCRGTAHSARETIQKGFKDVLGSVPDYCVHHCPCDVLIVRPPEDLTVEADKKE